jgi:anti-anti-sigma regulatory factor
MSTGFDNGKIGPREGGALAVQRAEPGEHLCSYHGTDDEQRRLVTAFVGSALGAGDRVVYVANQRGPDAIAGLMEGGGVDADGSLRTGQLLIRDFAAVYGSPDETDVDAVLAGYRSEADRSRADGYPGLRVAVEMGDFVAALGSVDAVLRWEHSVTPMLDEVGIVAMCQYDQRLVDARAWARIAAVHPVVATDDGTVPLATFIATDAPSGVKIAGELDRSNAGAFARVLAARALVSPRVHVDLEAVTFVDLAGLRSVFELAGELPSGSVLVLRRPPMHVRRGLGLLQWHDDRVELDPR